VVKWHTQQFDIERHKGQNDVVKQYGPYKSNGGHEFYVEIEDDGSRRSVFAHRVIMEKHLGHPLQAGDVIHHKNGNPSDNRIENLEVMSSISHLSLHRIAMEIVDLECLGCGTTFRRKARYERHNRNQGKYGPFCSRSCAARWARLRQIVNGRANLRNKAT